MALTELRENMFEKVESHNVVEMRKLKEQFDLLGGFEVKFYDEMFKVFENCIS